MDPKHRAKLRRTLGLLGRMTAELQFIYTSADIDSFPSLTVSERISALDVLHIRRRAKSSDFVRGCLIRLEDGRIGFQIERGTPAALTNFQAHLRGILKEQLPILKGARIIFN